MFEVCDRKWRGIGGIPESGLNLREEYAEFDADRIFGTEGVTADEPAECISAEVLQGLKKPTDCSAFGTRCTPENPLGAPMVSSEGACAAYYRYRRHALAAKANRLMPSRNETRRGFELSGSDRGDGVDSAGPRKRRPNEREAPARDSPSGSSKSRARTPGRPGHRRCRGIANCVYDGLLRREAAIFPRRRHRNAGGERHRE